MATTPQSELSARERVIARTKIVGHSGGFPIKEGERRPFNLNQAFDAKPKQPKLSAVRPNVGLQVAYRQKIMRLVREMADSVEYWLTAAYRKNPPAMAMDATPARELQDAINRMSSQWQKRFSEAAPELADYFATGATKQSDSALKAILRKAGMTVKFTWRMNPQMRDVFAATVQENVGLIKSIPAQYFTEIEGLVMRSVQAGRDLSFLTKELIKRYGITERRARFIALDQNNKSSAALTRARQTSLGIDEGIWMHSGAGKEPRPTHVANSWKKFNLATGWYDPAIKKYIWPGTEPRCRCVWKPIVPGFS